MSIAISSKTGVLVESMQWVLPTQIGRQIFTLINVGQNFYSIVGKIPKGSSTSSKSSSISTKAIESIIEDLCAKQHRNSTLKNYYNIWKIFNLFFIRLDVKPNNWEDRITLFAAYLIDLGRKSRTVKSYVSAIKAVLAKIRIEVMKIGVYSTP